MAFLRLMIGFIFLLLPVAEIVTYVVVARKIGLMGVVGLTILSTIVGIVLLRLESLNSLRELQQSLRQQQAPLGTVIRASCAVIGAILMIIPGLLTSSVGLLLALPGLRDMLAAAAETWFFYRYPAANAGSNQSAVILETTYTVIDDTVEKKDAGDQ